MPFFSGPSSSIDPGSYVALGLTHVQYDGNDPLAKLLALVTLSPIFLLCSYVTIILYRRELTFINALIGQLGCEGLNWGLKRLIRQPRPYGHLGKGYGMPSSHCQFIGFFGAFFLSHFYLHHPKAATPRTLVNTMRRFEHLIAMLAIAALTALTCYSRYHLSYHTPLQIFVGLSIGLVVGFSYYYLTEHIPRQPVRLPAPLGSPVASPRSSPTATARMSPSSSSQSSSSLRQRNGKGLNEGTAPKKGHHRRRSSLQAFMPELHPAPPLRQLILDHPLAVACRLRDSWTVWLDGGIEGEYEAWRREWERRRAPSPYAREGGERMKGIQEALEGVLSTGSGRASTASETVLDKGVDPLAPDTEAAVASSPTSASNTGAIPNTSDPIPLKLMKLALQQASQCEPTTTAFCVGCVIAIRGTDQVLASGYSRELEGNTHAEQCALEKLLGTTSSIQPEEDTIELDLYTTMEPCSERLSGSTPCVQRILAFNNQQHKGGRMQITRIYQGVTEPTDFIANNVGLRLLRQAELEIVTVRPKEEGGGQGWIEREALRLAKWGHEDQAEEKDGESRFWKEGG